MQIANSTLATSRLARGSVPDACMTFDNDEDDETRVMSIRPMIQDSPAFTNRMSTNNDIATFTSYPPQRRSRKETIRQGIYIDTVTRDGRIIRELFGSPAIECPGCGALAVCQMPPVLASLQEDGTEFACLPHHGGCGGGLKRSPCP